MRHFSYCAAAAILALSVTSAEAAVIGGGVTGGVSQTNGGSFVQLFPTAADPLTIGNDSFDDWNLYAFDEDQNITISMDVNVNIGTNPVAGDIVASHYVAYDPPSIATRRQIGYVDFDADIYGVASSTTFLDASDYLANSNTTYLSNSLRGLEAGDNVWIDTADVRRLWVNWAAGSPGDYVRVFTMESPSANVPIPASALLLIGGLAGFGALRSRKV